MNFKLITIDRNGEDVLLKPRVESAVVPQSGDVIDVDGIPYIVICRKMTLLRPDEDYPNATRARLLSVVVKKARHA